jgi:hypothetical protein
MVRLSEPKFGGPEWQEASEQKAEQLLAQELTRRGWEEQTLAQRPKGDPEKLQLAERLRTETTMTWKWIAQRLRMGSAGYVANCLRQRRR